MLSLLDSRVAASPSRFTDCGFVPPRQSRSRSCGSLAHKGHAETGPPGLVEVLSTGVWCGSLVPSTLPFLHQALPNRLVSSPIRLWLYSLPPLGKLLKEPARAVWSRGLPWASLPGSGFLMSRAIANLSTSEVQTPINLSLPPSLCATVLMLLQSPYLSIFPYVGEDFLFFLLLAEFEAPCPPPAILRARAYIILHCQSLRWMPAQYIYKGFLPATQSPAPSRLPAKYLAQWKSALIPAGHRTVTLQEPGAVTRWVGPWCLLWLMWSESCMRQMFLLCRHDCSNVITLQQHGAKISPPPSVSSPPPSWFVISFSASVSQPYPSAMEVITSLYLTLKEGVCVCVCVWGSSAPHLQVRVINHHLAELGFFQTRKKL